MNAGTIGCSLKTVVRVSAFIRTRAWFRDWSAERQCGAEHRRQGAEPEGPVGGSPGARCVLKRVGPTNGLRVGGVLDLEPRRCDAIGVIRTVLPFRDDAFEIGATNRSEQVDPLPLNVVEIEESRLDARDERLQAALALQQWPIP